MRRREPQRGVEVVRDPRRAPARAAGSTRANSPAAKSADAFSSVASSGIMSAGRGASLRTTGAARGADVAEAGQPALRVLVEIRRRARRVRRRHRVVLERLAHAGRQLDAGPQVARLTGIRREVVGLDRSREDRLVLPRHRHHLRLPAVFEERLHRFAEHDLAGVVGRAGCARHPRPPSRGACERSGAC